MNGRILALAAVLTVLPNGLRMCDAAPPAGSPWRMTFSDEFSRPDLPLEKWLIKPRWTRRDESNVLRDYVEINDGVCRLLTRTSDDGKTWKTAQLISRGFEQRYGYFEARIRISRMSGLTHVLALISRDRSNNRRLFYIDVVHAHYPNQYLTQY